MAIGNPGAGTDGDKNLRVLCFDLSLLSSTNQLIVLTLGALSTAIGFAFLQVGSIYASIL